MRQSDRVAVGFREFAGEFAGLNGGADFYARDVAGLGREGAASLKVFPERCEEGGIKPRKRVSGKFNVCLPAGVAVRRCGGSGRPVSLPDPFEIETEAGQDRGSVNAAGVVEHLDGESGDSRYLVQYSCRDYHRVTEHTGGGINSIRPPSPSLPVRVTKPLKQFAAGSTFQDPVSRFEEILRARDLRQKLRNLPCRLGAETTLRLTAQQRALLRTALRDTLLPPLCNALLPAPLKHSRFPLHDSRFHQSRHLPPSSSRFQFPLHLRQWRQPLPAT